MATVIDFSAAYPSPQAVKAAGHEGVMLYLSPPRETWMGGKKLTKTIVDGYKAAGLKIATCWQYGAGNAHDSDVMRGAAGGRADAEAAQKRLSEVGLPGHPVYFCVDFDISLNQWNSVAVEYFKAAGRVLGKHRVGGYGHSRCVHWMLEDQVVATVAPGRVLGWVTKSWSNGATGSNYSTLYQGTHNVPGPNGVQIDINTVRHGEWGWRAIPTPKEPAVDVKNLPKVDETRWMNKNFTKGRHFNGRAVKVEKITRHHMGGIGDAQQCWNWWQTRPASAHFAVDRNGKVGQLVREEDTAHSNASPASNAVSITIEHSNSAGAAQDWPISNATIDGGARLAAELCIKHGLGRPLFGKNIDDHKDHSATACPYHLANGGKYHARWMRVAQDHYDKLTTQSEEDDMFTDNDRAMLRDLLAQATGNHKVGEFPGFPQLGGKTPVDALALLLDQIVGPAKTDKGAFAFTGWPEEIVKGNGGQTLVEALAEVQVAVKKLQAALEDKEK